MDGNTTLIDLNMKKVNFKNLYLSYFLSTGEKVELDYKDGIFFVRGDNQTTGQNKQNNGVGKTAIFLDGLVYALYGETSRKLKKSEIPFNKGGKRKCIVQLKFEVETGDETKLVKIIRTINPSKFQLYVDDENISNSNASATQEHLVNEILGGIKREVFQHSIAMKVNSTIPFMSMTKVDRDKFIGGIFDLSYLKECEKIAREEYNECSKEVGKMEVRLNEAKPNVDKIQNQITTLKEQEELKRKERDQKILILEEQISEIVIGDRPQEINFEEKNKILVESINKLEDFIKNAERKEKERLLEEHNKKLELERVEREKKMEIERKEHEVKMEIERKEQERMVAEHNEKIKLEREESERKAKEYNQKMEIERLEGEIITLKSDMDKKVLECSQCGHNVLEDSKKKIQNEVEEKEKTLEDLKSKLNVV